MVRKGYTPEQIINKMGWRVNHKRVERGSGERKVLKCPRSSPWENGYIESFNSKLRDELLNREVFTTLEEARVLIKQWRREYNQIRPHSDRNYRPPTPEAILTMVTT
jgi:transposase InsO family protein